MWPLHPQPRKYEPLTLWLERIARSYGVGYRTFCRQALAIGDLEITEFCETPSEKALEKLSAGTGVPLRQLREMTTGALLSQFQTELQVALGKFEAATAAWLSDQVRISYSSDRKYWQTIEFWERELTLKVPPRLQE